MSCDSPPALPVGCEIRRTSTAGDHSWTITRLASGADNAADLSFGARGDQGICRVVKRFRPYFGGTSSPLFILC
jgi:hypothetical protein